MRSSDRTTRSTWSHGKLEAARKGSPLGPQEGTRPCWFQIPGLQNAENEFLVFEGTQLLVICCDSRGNTYTAVPLALNTLPGTKEGAPNNFLNEQYPGNWQGEKRVWGE